MTDPITIVAGDVIDVSIVIVSWNVSNLLDNCLESVLRQVNGFDYEIIVVDNASSDDTVEVIRNKYPQIKVLVNEENLGFARANNQGFKIARGKYIFILNPDTILIDRALNILLDYMNSNPKVGAAGPKIINSSGSIQTTCAWLLPSLARTLFCTSMRLHKIPVFGHYFNKRYISPYQYNVTQTVEAISGAAMLVRGEIITSNGGFREVYFHTGEDVDLCYRIQKQGWKIAFVSEAAIIHLAGQSSKQARVRTAINGKLSVEQYYKNCVSDSSASLYRLIVKVIDIPVTMLISVIKFALGKMSVSDMSEAFAIARGLWKWKWI